LWRLPKGWKPEQLILLPNGLDAVVASSKEDRETSRLSLWDVATGRERQTILDLPPEKDWSSRLQHIECSPDGRWMAVSVLREGGIRKNKQGAEDYVSADRLHVIDLATHKIEHTGETPGFVVCSLKFSHDSRRLATAQFHRVDWLRGERRVSEFNGDVRLWDVASGVLIKALRGERGEGPTRAEFAPDRKSLGVAYSIAGSDQPWRGSACVKIWELENSRVRVVIPNRSQPKFLADDRALLMEGRPGNLILRDLEQERDRVLFSFTYPREWLRHRRIESDGRSVFCYFDDGRMVLLELPSGKVLAQKQSRPGKAELRRVRCTAQSPDGRLFAFSDYTEPRRRVAGTMVEDWEEVPPPEIHVWDALSLEPLVSMTGHIGRIEDVDFAADGRSLFSAGSDGTIRIWDLSDMAQAAKR
jgi:WD40 repeat protein